MDRMRRIAGMGKAKAPPMVQEDKDESIVFFRELHKREKHRDVNLLEPMYSIDFNAIQGKHMSRIPSGKEDYLIPVDEKHDYDWLKTSPATPLFPSLEMDANSSQMVFQKELPIPRPPKSSASRLSGKPEAAKTSSRRAAPTPDTSSKKNIIKGAPTFSREENQTYTIHKRSTYTALTTRKQKAASAATSATTSAVKKHSDRCYASQGSVATAVKRVTNTQVPYETPKNLLAAGSIFARHAPLTARARFRDPALGVDVKEESGKTRRQSCPPAATRGIKELQLDDKLKVWTANAKGKPVAGTGSEHASSSNSRAGEATLMKRRPKFGSQMNK